MYSEHSAFQIFQSMFFSFVSIWSSAIEKAGRSDSWELVATFLKKTVLFSTAKKRVISEHSVTLVQSSLVNKTLVVPELNDSLSVFRETY